MIWNSQWFQCFGFYLRHISANSAATHHYYKNTLVRFFSRSAGDGPPKAPDAYTRVDVEDFIYLQSSQHRRNQGQPPAASTKNLRLAVIQSFYRYASEYMVPDENGLLIPLFRGRLPTAGIASSKPECKYRAMSPEEVRRFFAAIDTSKPQGKRDLALFLTLLYTARRVREIAELRWGDIEYTTVVDGQIRREAFVYHFKGKGRKMQDDSQELPLPCYQAIEEWLRASGRLATIKKDEPVFLGVGNGSMSEPFTRPLWTTTINHVMKRYAKKADLDTRRLSAHSWRHTSAQIRYHAGEDIRSVQRLLRHSTLAVTDRYLLGLSSEADSGSQYISAQFGYLSRI